MANGRSRKRGSWARGKRDVRRVHKAAYFRERESKLVEKAAKAAGLSTSTWIREVILRELGEESGGGARKRGRRRKTKSSR